MSETRRLALPLLQAGQAQKHVTMNEAMTRIDALAAPTAISRSVSTPPVSPVEGDLFIAPPGASHGWTGWDGGVVYFDNGGWSVSTPYAGMRVWVADEGAAFVFDGTEWVPAEGTTAGGAATALRILTIDHPVAPGATSLSTAVIPDKAVVIGVTGRVLESLAGPGLTGWRLGVPGGPGRYGGSYGCGAGSFAVGVTSAPTAYFGATPLLIEAENGVFERGIVRLAVHFFALVPPRVG